MKYVIPQLLFVLCVLLLTLQIYNMQKQIENVEDTIARLSLYSNNNYEYAKVNGIYNTKGYYCVWTQNRTLEEINRTDYHEMAHVLVHKDREHFCG